MAFTFSKSSLSKLEGVDFKLRLLAEKVLKISPIDFAITEGVRTKKEQQLLFKHGKSKCDGINSISKHQEGKAIDICPVINGKLDYTAETDLFFIVGLFYIKAIEIRNIYGLEERYNLDYDDLYWGFDITIRTGALWDNNSIKGNKFVDGYHIELI
jgi:peptidoglycan L-alanyl-D-glutamate endopeptidase CwlK